MPYKRRRKRKSSVRSRIARIAVRAVEKSQAGSRVYKYEERNKSLSVPAGEYTWAVACIFGDTDTSIHSFKNIIEATNTDEGSALGGDADDPQRKFRITNNTNMLHLRNMSPHPIFLHIYEITPKQHIELLTSGASAINYPLYAMKDGWRALTDSTGDAYVGSPDSNNQMSTESNMLWPSQSKFFTKQFRIIKKKKFKLNSGDDVFWRVKIPNFTFDPQWLLPNDDNPTAGTGGQYGTDRHKDLIKNISRHVIIKMEGSLGHDTADQTLVGPMSCDVAMECQSSARVMEINQKDNAMAVTRTEDPFTALEGPTEESMTVDD